MWQFTVKQLERKLLYSLILLILNLFLLSVVSVMWSDVQFWYICDDDKNLNWYYIFV